ncbi:MAG: cyclase family protein [Ilumatobacteraceae bacterium]
MRPKITRHVSRRTVVAAALVLGGFGAGSLTSIGDSAIASKKYHSSEGLGDVVFLSHVNTETMPIFPGDPVPVIEDTFTVENDGFKLQTVTIGDHSGTHWGAPCHFNEGEACAQDMNPEDFVHPAVVVDIRAQSAADPDYALTVEDLKKFERRNGRIPRDAVVIAWTGWQEKWNDAAAYFNQDADEVMHYPGISAEATSWLIDTRRLGGLGIDTHGVDPGADVTYLTNTLLLQDHRIHIENMTGLEQLPPIGAWVVVGGVRNEGGSGSPATVLGLIPD